MKSLIQKLLARKAQRLVRKFHPIVIAVTGSMGKTSTRDAIATILSGRFSVRTPLENYNNEFGVPLAILGHKSPGTSVFGWLRILLERHPTFPNVLVLEYGADRPGDIVALCKLIQPQIGVLTGISPVHLENYPSLDSLVQEKAHLLTVLPANGLVVLNADDETVFAQKEKATASVIAYGFSSRAEVKASDYVLVTKFDDSFTPNEHVADSTFRVALPSHEEADIVLKNILGKSQVSAIGAAFAVGAHLSLSLAEMVERVSLYQPPNGRLRPIAGIKGSLILDDTYNAAPASVLAALDVLHDFEPAENRRRIAVLGDMAELGSRTQDEQRNVGLRAAEGGVDLLVCVGPKSQDTGKAAEEAGMERQTIVYFNTAEEAGRYLDREIRTGDIILVKGSQGMRMERVVKDLMAEPLRASELLVRQYGKWIEEKK